MEKQGIGWFFIARKACSVAKEQYQQGMWLKGENCKRLVNLLCIDAMLFLHVATMKYIAASVSLCDNCLSMENFFYDEPLFLFY